MNPIFENLVYSYHLKIPFLGNLVYIKIFKGIFAVDKA
jgi:hypothetical protein